MNSSLWALMAPTQGGSAGTLIFIGQLAAIFAIFYFLLMRPQQQARKKHATMLANLKKGDEIMTAGGIIGKVRDIKDTRVTVESGGSTLLIDRSRIVKIGDVLSPTAT